MARHLWRSWDNRGYVYWTCRICWYQERDGSNIRLEIEDSERKENVYPPDTAHANAAWTIFKKLAPPPGADGFCVVKTLEELEERFNMRSSTNRRER